MKKSAIIISISLAVLVNCELSCSRQKKAPSASNLLKSCRFRELSDNFKWHRSNKDRLNAMIKDLGCGNPAYDETKKPIAIFDLDDTLVKNDTGHFLYFWMIRNDRIIQPPNKDWSVTNRYFTPEIIKALSSACDDAGNPGEPLQTSKYHHCADEIWSITKNETSISGARAFLPYDHHVFDPLEAWHAQLLSGYTADEIKGFARSAFNEAFSATIGSGITLGNGRVIEAWLRMYEEQMDLIASLSASGFDVWICSATEQNAVKALADRIGVVEDHVIGARLLADEKGRMTYRMEGCGPYPDGSDRVMTKHEGKRCFINKVIFGDKSADAIKVRPESSRQQFSAGDTASDVYFLMDATYLKLAINRNREPLMCNAYNNAGNKWIINPMFIDPFQKYGKGYSCSTTSCSTKDGEHEPCYDENGKLIQFQEDTVF